jgi:hypothetical protein
MAAPSGPFDPYRILGIPPTASAEEVKKAYHRLALRFHPDGGPEGNKERFQAVHEAYEAVKSGKWKPEAGNEGAPQTGWNPRRNMYVYEEPGSTTENYVSGDPALEAKLKILLVASIVVLVARVVMFMCFPRHRQDAPSLDGIQSSGSGAGPTATRESVLMTNSVHSDRDYAEYLATRGQTESDDPPLDPLRRR